MALERDQDENCNVGVEYSGLGGNLYIAGNVSGPPIEASTVEYVNHYIKKQYTQRLSRYPGKPKTEHAAALLHDSRTRLHGAWRCFEEESWETKRYTDVYTAD
ncbi:hypothetical protein BDQ17DRAFT_1337594 [Cyathus striatus]|nr:hypothetical protein BDQ17DRAFT_1337594 [Cyathus striatus]